jgi:isochorismate synthase
VEPVARTRELCPSRLAVAVAEVRPTTATVAARAIQAAARGGTEALRALESPSILWVPRAAGGDDLRGDDDVWSFAGWGVAARIDGAGEARLAEVQDRAERLWSRVDRAGALPIAPRLFGGFAFDAGASARPETDLARAWAPLGDAMFLLPRLLFGSSGDRAFVAAFAPEPEKAAALADAARRAFEVEQSVFDPADSVSPALTFEEGGEREWIDLVSAAVAEIERRAFRKVVLCRTRRAVFAREPDLLRGFALLEERHRPCVRFLFEQGGVAFLGATPERLVLVRGRRAVTEALAGSLPRRAGDDVAVARARLLASEKDRAEHAFVVDAIRAALGPSCDVLSIPEVPGVRSLAHVHHLATPITAALAARAHVLDLAARLHPTPALCGTPRAEARAFLTEREPQPRGWYGGGAGWIDASGDGEIAVAIRSALTDRRSAWIYAGAGIVSGSDPRTEYIETTVKERAMREALEASA